MKKEKVLAVLSRVRELSSPPTILNETLRLINDQDVSTKELSEIILKDPSLTSRILKIANSSFYGLAKEVTTVNQAIMVMGLNAVKYFILSIAVFNQVLAQKNRSRLDQKHLWTHFLEVAAASKKIAEHIDYVLPEEAYVAGLLHDIGLVLLECYFPIEYENVLRLTSQGKSICEAEKEVFGLDHQEVADSVAERWKMPNVLREPLSHHHIEDADDIALLSDVSKIVGLADCIAQVPFDAMNNLLNAEKRIIALTAFSEALGIDSDTLIKIHMKLTSEVVTSATAMELDAGDAIDILTQSNAKLFNIYLELASLFRERQEISRKLLMEERTEGTLESLKISLATLSHYINNATMNIQGKCDILRLFYEKNDPKTLVSTLPEALSSMQKSVKKISLILEELSNISSLENLRFFSNSRAIDIEAGIKAKLTSQFEIAEIDQP